MPLTPPRARYQQVADDLREAIERGTYGAGTRLPSQPQLARKYGLNQASISRAIGVLEAEGLVHTERGVGSVVLDSPVERLRQMPPHNSVPVGSHTETEAAHEVSRPLTAELKRAEAAIPHAQVALRLEWPSPELALIRERHLLDGDKVIQVETSCVPMAIAGDVSIAYPDTDDVGFYERLAKRGYRAVRVREEVVARWPTVGEADLLRIGTRMPVFEVVRFAFDRDGNQLEAAFTISPTRAWKLAYEISLE